MLRDPETCVRCDGTGTNRDRTCGCCGGDGREFDLAEDIEQDRTARLRFERYQALLAGEMVGMILGAGIVLVCAGNPYVGLLFVLSWLAFHVTARTAIRAG